MATYWNHIVSNEDGRKTHQKITTYREKQVNHVHQDQGKVADSRVAVPIRGVDEGARDDVMGEHLPVVLSALLDVDNNELLEPEGQLCEHVSLHKSRELAVWEIRPQLVEAEVGRGVAIDVLTVN